MTDGRALLELQDVDLKLGRLDRKLSEMPEKRNILKLRKRIADITSLRDRTADFITEIERGISRLEDEVETISTKMDTEQTKLLSGKVVDAKEAQNLSLELDGLRRRKERLESQILEQMERREKAIAQRDKVDTALDESGTQEEDLVEGFKGKGGELQDEIERLHARREELLALLDDPLVRDYERIRRDRGGVGAARLADSTCSACRMELPADRADELSSEPGIKECPLCHRLLVVLGPDEPGPGEEDEAGGQDDESEQGGRNDESEGA